MKLFELKATTKTGNPIEVYFETDQGSKYILSSKNESKRIKSYHANTGGEDQGLHKWYERCVFVAAKYVHEANSPQMLINKGFKVYLSEKGSKIAFYQRVDRKFEVLTWDDAFPKSNRGKVPLVFEFTETPTKGFSVVEFNINPATKELKSYHFGSPVSLIKKFSELTDQEALAFKDK